MKDEIKEINIKIPGQILDYVDTKEHLIELFNYITNLQEEINKLTAESTEWESKCYDLQEELKEYKMIFDAFSKRPYAHRYLEEKKKELGNNKIIGLDSEMIYKDYYDLKEKNERLLKTQEMYEKKCNKIHQYITQNCEIIRHKDYDEIGKVNGGHILFLLNGDDK